MLTKELNLKFNESFIHMRTDGNIYRIAINNDEESISFDLLPQDFQILHKGMANLEDAIKK